MLSDDGTVVSTSDYTDSQTFGSRATWNLQRLDCTLMPGPAKSDRVAILTFSLCRGVLTCEANRDTTVLSSVPRPCHPCYSRPQFSSADGKSAARIRGEAAREISL
jgi:hypothetical protein